MTDPGTDPAADPAPSRPAPLLVAGSLAAVEGLLLGLYGVAEIASTSGDRVAMGLTTAAFFLAYGGGLAWCAWLMVRGSSWARSPVVMAQLIQLGVAWSFRGGSSTPVAVGLALVALVVLGGVFHRASLQALADGP